MRYCIFASSVLLALLAGCSSTKPVQPKPIGITRGIEPQTSDTSKYVAPQGMNRAEVYDLLDERSEATNKALEAKERQSRQKKTRRSVDRFNIYLGAPSWHYGYHRPYYYGHCRPWYGHHHVYHRHW